MIKMMWSERRKSYFCYCFSSSRFLISSPQCIVTSTDFPSCLPFSLSFSLFSHLPLSLPRHLFFSQNLINLMGFLLSPPFHPLCCWWIYSPCHCFNETRLSFFSSLFFFVISLYSHLAILFWNERKKNKKTRRVIFHRVHHHHRYEQTLIIITGWSFQHLLTFTVHGIISERWKKTEYNKNARQEEIEREERKRNEM